MRLHNFFRLSSLQNKTEIELFSSDVHVLVEVLDAQAKKIEFEKLKVLTSVLFAITGYHEGLPEL